jgi:hypothetical protein
MPTDAYPCRSSCLHTLTPAASSVIAILALDSARLIIDDQLGALRLASLTQHIIRLNHRRRA